MAGIYRIEQPTLCMVMGVPASGKSALSEELARAIIDASYNNKDLIEDPFTNNQRVNGLIYSLVCGPTFNILVNYAGTQLRLGKVPIIDAPFSVNGWRKDEYSDFITPFRKAAESYNARLAVIRCAPENEEILKKVIAKRGLERDKWKLEHWDEFLEQEPIQFTIPHNDVLEITSYTALDEMLQKSLKFLKAVKIHQK